MGYSTKAVLFDGTNEHVSVGDVLGFEYTSPFSISCWAKTSNAVFQMLVAKMGDTPVYQGYALSIVAGQLSFFLGSDVSGTNFLQVDTSTTYNDGNWHHVCITWDGNGTPGAGGVNIYVDGVAVATSVTQNTLSATIITTNALYLGGRASVGELNPFDGTLDEVAIYNKELSSVEVTAIFNDGSPGDLSLLGSVANLSAWWRMGDDDVFPTLYDWVGTEPRIPNLVAGNDGEPANMVAGNVQADVPGGTFTTNSLSFDGVNENLDMKDTLDFERTAPFSVVVWFKSSLAADGVMLAKQTAAPALQGYAVTLQSDGAVRFVLVNDWAISDAIHVHAGSGLDDGAWHCAVICYDGSSDESGVTFYLDDVLTAHTSVTNGLTGTTLTAAPFRIGTRADGTDPYAGSLDEIAIYDKELSNPQATEIYNSGEPTDLLVGGLATHLVGWWRMGEDYLPFGGNDGTMVNMESGDIVEDFPSIVRVEAAMTGDASASGLALWSVTSSVVGDASAAGTAMWLVTSSVAGDASAEGTSMWLIVSSVAGDASAGAGADVLYSAASAVVGDAALTGDMTFLIYSSVVGDSAMTGELIYSISAMVQGSSSSYTWALLRKSNQPLPTIGSPPVEPTPRMVGYQPDREAPVRKDTYQIVTEDD
jgi:Concanavalin A-like lectin/glucanases superfamily